eukprot:scaffold64395_cov99-Phaeocystis_antarctica.AAC.1
MFRQPPKGPEGLTRHYEVSPSQYMAAETGGWRRTASRSVNDNSKALWRVPRWPGQSPSTPHSRTLTTGKTDSTPNAWCVAPPPRPSGDLLPGAEVVQAAAGK